MAIRYILVCLKISVLLMAVSEVHSSSDGSKKVKNFTEAVEIWENLNCSFPYQSLYKREKDGYGVPDAQNPVLELCRVADENKTNLSADDRAFSNDLCRKFYSLSILFCKSNETKSFVESCLTPTALEEFRPFDDSNPGVCSYITLSAQNYTRNYFNYMVNASQCTQNCGTSEKIMTGVCKLYASIFYYFFVNSSCKHADGIGKTKNEVKTTEVTVPTQSTVTEPATTSGVAVAETSKEIVDDTAGKNEVTSSTTTWSTSTASLSTQSVISATEESTKLKNQVSENSTIPGQTVSSQEATSEPESVHENLDDSSEESTMQDTDTPGTEEQDKPDLEIDKKKHTPEVDEEDTDKGDAKDMTVKNSNAADSDADESPGSGHFLAYFLTAVVICITGYVVYHNKQKIMAFIIEGRNTGKNGRQRSKDVKYSQLKSNVEEVMPSLEQTRTSKNFIY